MSTKGKTSCPSSTAQAQCAQPPADRWQKATEAEACACAGRLQRVAAMSLDSRLSPAPAPRAEQLEQLWASHPGRLGRLAPPLSPATHPVGCSGQHAWALYRPLRIASQPLLSPPPAANARLGLAARGASVLWAPSWLCPALPSQ